MGTEPVQDLTETTPAESVLAARRSVEHTAALRVSAELLKYTCPRCLTTGAYVYSTQPPVRYVRCARCGTTGKIVV